MYYLPISCLVFFFLFSLFHLLPCAASKEEHEWCEALFQCGNITAGFPFWGEKRHHHCGHPLLELQCFNNITSLTISDNLYNVIHIDQSSNTLKLVRTDVLGSVCSSTFTNATLPSEIFELFPTYKSVTFYNCFSNHFYLLRYTCPEKGQMSESVNPEYPESCHNSFTVNVPKNFSPKEKDLNLNYLGSVLEEGFEVKVKIDVKACEECLSTHKFCGFNKSSPLEVKCGPLHQPTANELHKRCSGTFSCGNQRNLYYPFWIPETEGCGHPEFKLECGLFAEFRVSYVKFRVLEMNSSIIRLARLDFIDELCPDYPPDELFNKNVLPLAPNTEMLTIYFDCKLDFAPSLSPFGTKLDCADDRTDDKTNYYVTRNLSSSLLYGIRGQLNDLRVCDRNVSIPASGPALTSLQRNLSADNLQKALKDGFDLGLNQECLTCLESRGSCGYNLNSDRFTCYFLKNKGLSTAAKIGIGAALAMAGFILLVVGIFCIISCQRKTSDDLRQRNLKALIPLKHYSYAQVKRITNSFTKVVGKGGFGTVYRGTLSDGRSVAVKILKDSKGNGEDFINEVASMSKTSHVNIVDLLGFCSEGSKRAIIYEYLKKGSLDQFISRNTSKSMDWMALYKIALGVARGLEYLHHGCKTRIVHFDIKPQNVLLDDNLCPKVSDFGLAKLCEKKESFLSLLDARGTIGYIAPEVISRMYGRVSHKSDVYSYGMLILEMIGARNKRDYQNSASNTSSMYFPEWIYKDLEKGDNGRLIKNGISCKDDEIAKKMMLVGLWCIQPWPSDRPAMNRVVEMMEGSVDALEVPPRPVLQCSLVSRPESSLISEEHSIP